MATTATETRVVEVTGAGSPDFDALVGVWQAEDAERAPGDPVTPAREIAVDLFETPPTVFHRAWIATQDGEPVGAAYIEQERDGTNDTTCELFAMTPSGQRRRGVARALAAVGLDALVELGATSVLGAARDDTGAGFCQALGPTHRQDERCSRLHLSDLDDAQQQRWIDEAPTHAPGYRLEGWVGVCPDEWAEPLARALDAMIDAPLDDIDWSPQPLTVDQLLQRERFWTAKGGEIVTTLALSPRGEPAGASQIVVFPDRLQVAEQSDTGVVAAHRGHRLGRWLKAANLRRARDHAPGIESVQTYNAETNPHMLAINVDMGFRPYLAYAIYQGPVATAREAVRA
jgi:GNAT superfamily N-acetyltransferase